MKIKFVFLFFILPLFFAKPVLAEVYFFDDFSNNSLSKWQACSDVICNGWTVSGGRLVGSIYENAPTAIYGNWNNSGVIGDYKIEADVQNLSGIDQVFYVRVSPDKSKYYQIDFRYDEPAYGISDKNNITLTKFDGLSGPNLIAQYPDSLRPRFFNITQNEKHHVKIIVSVFNIKVYFDNHLAIDYSDYASPRVFTGGFGILNWKGNCPVVVKNEFDNLIVSSIDDTWTIPTNDLSVSLPPSPTPTLTVVPTVIPTLVPTLVPTLTPTLIPTLTPTLTPTPTPSATPTPKRKIIFVPGMGASWNTEAMVYNRVVADDDWKMTPFVNNYNSFLDALGKNGLKKDVDYFVWNYDWRRPITEIVGKLNGFIDSKILVGEKVDIVGHSLGGIVGRIWLQDHKNDSRVNQVIAVASPQFGAVDAYSLWNGGRVIGRDDVASVGLDILVELHKKDFQTKTGALRAYAPIIKNLIPVFDFVKKDGRVIKSSDLLNKNDFLVTKNIGVSDVFSNYLSMVGIGVSTIEWVNLGQRSIFDKILNIWPDGEIKSYANGDGDGSVLPKSVIFNGDDFITVNSGHGEVIQKGAIEVLERIGLDGNGLIGENIGIRGKKIYFMGSPAKVRAECVGKSVTESDDQGFLVIEEKDICKITIVGTGSGTYHLVSGVVGGNDWSYIENEIKVGQIIDLASSDDWKDLMRRDIALLQKQFKENKTLDKAKKDLDKNDSESVVKDIIRFRKETKEVIITDRLIDSGIELMSINSRKINPLLVALRGRVEQWRFSLKDKNDLKIGLVEAINHQKVEELLLRFGEDMKKSNYARAWAEIEVAKDLD